jgi:hypothetical protein
MDPIYTPDNVPTGQKPVITSFTANPNIVPPGSPVTLNWSSTGTQYYVVSPEIGAVRGTTAIVHPAQTTTYTLFATNQYGRSKKTVKVTVQ